MSRKMAPFRSNPKLQIPLIQGTLSSEMNMPILSKASRLLKLCAETLYGTPFEGEEKVQTTNTL